MSILRDFTTQIITGAGAVALILAIGTFVMPEHEFWGTLAMAGVALSAAASFVKQGWA